MADQHTPLPSFEVRRRAFEEQLQALLAEHRVLIVIATGDITTRRCDDASTLVIVDSPVMQVRDAATT